MIIRTSKQVLLTFVSAILIPVTLVRADNGPAHRIAQNFPTSLGTSGGNINDRSKAFCYGGTLGALVEDANKAQYILSNNHVLARTNAAKLGEDIIQPGLIDQSPVCAQDSSDAVADLSRFVPIQFKGKGATPPNTVDAAIAAVRSGKVDPKGSILDIGVISDTILQPVIGLAVKKSGRTTGLTTGTISALDVTVDVSYGSGKLARFVDQILVTPGTFIDSGDSGSLMVEDLDPMPRAVGLLFAGSSSVAIANPIDDVLSAFGVTMVGASTTSLTGKLLNWAKNLFSVSESHAASAQLPSSRESCGVGCCPEGKSEARSEIAVGSWRSGCRHWTVREAAGPGGNRGLCQRTGKSNALAAAEFIGWYRGENTRDW